jgi:hypothetical protein
VVAPPKEKPVDVAAGGAVGIVVPPNENPLAAGADGAAAPGVVVPPPKEKPPPLVPAPRPWFVVLRFNEELPIPGIFIFFFFKNI